jgi:hypothetical protein
LQKLGWVLERRTRCSRQGRGLIPHSGCWQCGCCANGEAAINLIPNRTLLCAVSILRGCPPFEADPGRNVAGNGGRSAKTLALVNARAANWGPGQGEPRRATALQGGARARASADANSFFGSLAVVWAPQRGFGINLDIFGLGWSRGQPSCASINQVASRDCRVRVGLLGASTDTYIGTSVASSSPNRTSRIHPPQATKRQNPNSSPQRQAGRSLAGSSLVGRLGFALFNTRI